VEGRHRAQRGGERGGDQRREEHVKAPSRQWRTSADKLRNTMKTFKVLTAQA
jgi:hypothetical protein